MTEIDKGPGLDQDAVNAFAFQVWQYKQGEMVSLMIHLGDRLGLYKSLEGAGAVTPAELYARPTLGIEVGPLFASDDIIRLG